jgi:ribosome biogenesis GTPase
LDWGGFYRKSDIVNWPMTEEGVVISVSRKSCRIYAAGREIDCVIPARIASQQKSALAVGDRVRAGEESGTWRLEEILPRRTVLARPDPLNRHLERLIAANIDVVVNVVSAKSPPLRIRLIDRYLIAIQRGGAQPIICVNKSDLLDDGERGEALTQLEPYRSFGVPVITCSTRTGEGLDELRGAIDGKTAALVGHSGVGKSSILNALDARLQLPTGEILKRGKGGHTTTSSTLHDLGGGTYVIDTPGIREFGLWKIDRDSLRDYFPEFEELSESCRFNDCTHVHEPDCEVKRAVEGGELNRGRYEAYLRLMEEVA